MAKRSGAESGAGGASSHRGGAGFAGAGSQSGAGTRKKIQAGTKKVQADRKSDPHSEITTIQYREKLHMAMQKTPHTQSEQNRGPERSDLEPDEQQFESDSETEVRLYSEMKGAETGTDRSPRKHPLEVRITTQSPRPSLTKDRFRRVLLNAWRRELPHTQPRKKARDSRKWSMIVPMRKLA